MFSRCPCFAGWWISFKWGFDRGINLRWGFAYAYVIVFALSHVSDMLLGARLGMPPMTFLPRGNAGHSPLVEIFPLSSPLSWHTNFVELLILS